MRRQPAVRQDKGESGYSGSDQNFESNSIAKGIEAADAILKAADTSLLFSKPVCRENIRPCFTGMWRRSGVSGGRRARDGEHTVDSVVIPSIRR